MNISSTMKPWTAVVLGVMLFTAIGPREVVAADAELEFIDPLQSMVKVQSTNQDYDFQRPWSKKAPYTRSGLGAILEDNQVLVTASLLANHNFIELEKPVTGEKSAAEVVVVDYEANLALLRPVRDGFLDEFEPLQIEEEVGVGSLVDFWQLEATGAALVTPGVVTTVEVSNYILDDAFFLVCRVNASLEYREGSYTLPVVDQESGKLTGMLMRYQPRSQSAEVIPGFIMQRFLENAAGEEYRPFPRAGIVFSATRDPQFRRFLNLDGRSGGIYISALEEGGPAAEAGLERGDVILQLNGFPIDQNGNYDDPGFGLISAGHLLRATVASGEEVTVTYLRDGEEKESVMTMEPKSWEDYVSEPYTIDRGPNFIVAGGLIFQELSRQYLKEWGGDWRKRAPLRLVYFDEMQQEAAGDRDKIVFLSGVLPLSNTIGYEDLRHLVVERVNDREIRDLADLAKALDEREEGFHRFEFDEHPSLIFLDASETEEVNEALQSLYGLPRLQRLD